MNDKELIAKVNSSMYRQMKESNIAISVQVLMDIGVLSKQDYENWRFGRVEYLERVCKVNLRKLSTIMREVRAFARRNDLKPSWTIYKQCGRKDMKGPAIKLRFSKSCNEDIERGYATHYVSPRIKQVQSDAEASSSESVNSP